MYLVLRHSSRYVVIVQERIDNLYGGPQGYHGDGEHVLRLQAQPTKVLHRLSGHRSTAAYNYGENFCRGTSESSRDVVRCGLAFPLLVSESVGQAGPILVPQCDVEDHQSLPLFGHQIGLLEVASNVDHWLDEGGEPFRKFVRYEILYFVISPNAFGLRVEAHPQDVLQCLRLHPASFTFDVNGGDSIAARPLYRWCWYVT